LVFDVNKGAKKGLTDLKLIGSNAPLHAVVQEFKTLNDFLLERLTLEQREVMCYNIVMLEHGLCKHPHFVKISSKRKKVN